MCATQDCQLSQSAADEIVGNRRKTSLTRLAERYRRFAIFGLLWAGICVCKVFHGVLVEAFGRPGMIGLVFYFLLCAAMDFTLYFKVRAIDPLRMTTMEVIQRSYDCRKLHIMCIIILLPLIFLFGWWVVYMHHADPAILWAMALGAAVGAMFGIYQLRLFMADYKSVTSK